MSAGMWAAEARACVLSPCPRCKGTGRTRFSKVFLYCRNCSGNGQVYTRGGAL